MLVALEPWAGLRQLGETFEESQLDYHFAGPRPGRVMGDVGLAKNPRAVSNDSAERRKREAASHAELVEEVIRDPAFDWIRAESRRLSALPAVTRVSPEA